MCFKPCIFTPDFLHLLFYFYLFFRPVLHFFFIQEATNKTCVALRTTGATGDCQRSTERARKLFGSFRASGDCSEDEGAKEDTHVILDGSGDGEVEGIGHEFAVFLHVVDDEAGARGHGGGGDEPAGERRVSPRKARFGG